MLSFVNLIKSYQSGEEQLQALKSISANLQRGQFVGLTGPSGSGKSTLLNICGLLDGDYQGELYLDEQRVPNTRGQLTELRRQKIGFIFQHYNLIPVMTAYENVEYPLLMVGMNRSERRARVSSILSAVGLAQHAHKRPDQLSGGQQQRVSIARALVKRPSLVIADEPTANLDTETAHRIIALMQQIGQEQKTTFLIATHDHRMTAHCDRLLSLSDGLIREVKNGDFSKQQMSAVDINFENTVNQVINKEATCAG